MDSRIDVNYSGVTVAVRVAIWHDNPLIPVVGSGLHQQVEKQCTSVRRHTSSWRVKERGDGAWAMLRLFTVVSTTSKGTNTETQTWRGPGILPRVDCGVDRMLSQYILRTPKGLRGAKEVACAKLDNGTQETLS